MDIIFMNSKNSKTFEPHGLLLNLSNKIDLKRSDKYVALSNLYMYTVKNIKMSYSGMKNLNYLIVCILYQIFKIVLGKS